MTSPDLNLLVTLDVLLAEGSVTRAAKRLRLSQSAMSRALSRLRDVTGDPLLVRAGRGLVPSPRAVALRARVAQVVQDAQSLLGADEAIDLPHLVRTFTLRTSDGFVENFGARLIERVANEAPRVRLRFLHKVGKDSVPLRDGTVDLETGVVGKDMGPEIRAQGLFRDRFVGVVRKGHNLARGKVTASRYAAGRHVLVARRGLDEDRVDVDVAAAERKRDIGAIVSEFGAALALARGSDLIATVPERHTTSLRVGMFTFPLPILAREITVSLLWHPRMDADPAHQWLRVCVREVCRNETLMESSGRSVPE